MTAKADILHAIRGKCMDCSCYQLGEIRQCVVIACALWPFRMGSDPNPGAARGCAKSSLARDVVEDESVAVPSEYGQGKESLKPPLPSGRSHDNKGNPGLGSDGRSAGRPATVGV